MVFFVTNLFSAIYTIKDCTRESSAIHIRKMVEFSFPDGEWRSEKTHRNWGG
jgi:hypothetical protein